MSRIYLSPPHMSPDERALLLDAFDSNWVAPLGPHVDGFEADLASFVGIPHALALSSGTSALHLGLLEVGVSPGDVVLVSSFTFIASANAVVYAGAEPVFVDSDRETWCMCPDRLAEAIEAERQAGKRVAAVMAVDLYGAMPDYDRIVAVCKAAGVPLVEDAAEALGSRLNGRHAGTYGACAAFSFNGNKIITTSGGGMLVSSDDALIEHARYLSTQARQPVPHYEHTDIGFNYRMSNLLAAVGRGQLSHLNERIEARAATRAFYVDALGDLPGVDFMPIRDGLEPNHWLTTLTLDPSAGVQPEAVRVALQDQQIEARHLWKPMHRQPVFAGHRWYGDVVSDALFATGLCLPSGSALTDSDRARVVDAFRGVYV